MKKDLQALQVGELRVELEDLGLATDGVKYKLVESESSNTPTRPTHLLMLRVMSALHRRL